MSSTDHVASPVFSVSLDSAFDLDRSFLASGLHTRIRFLFTVSSPWIKPDFRRIHCSARNWDGITLQRLGSDRHVPVPPRMVS